MCTERELSLLADGSRACRRGRAAAGTRALTGPGPTACRKPGVARLSGNRLMAAPSEPVVTNDSIGSADIDKRYSGHGCGSSRAFARGTSPPHPFCHLPSRKGGRESDTVAKGVSEEGARNAAPVLVARRSSGTHGPSSFLLATLLSAGGSADGPRGPLESSRM
jgi:hypothetical protein